LAIRGYHVRKVAIYFGLIVLWRIGIGIYNSQTATAIALSCVFLLALGGVAMGVLSLLAYFTARSTVYSITSKRILLRHGVAVTLTMNVPFNAIEGADVKLFRDRSGDLAVKVAAEQRVGYLINWPHLRPDYITRPQPSFRALRDANTAAQILAQALAADAGVAPLRVDAPAQLPAAGAPASGGLGQRTAAA
jgi:hypothetical protein